MVIWSSWKVLARQVRTANTAVPGVRDWQTKKMTFSFSEADEDWNEGILPEEQLLGLESQSAGRDVETPPRDTFTDADFEPENVE
jgi:hypothetical protein